MISKFTASVEIDRPVKEVFELFLDKSHFKEWKKDYIGFEHLSGQPGQQGCVTKLIYKRQTMLETITSIDAPREIKTSYEHQHGGKTNMYHQASNHFSALTSTKTLLEVEMEVTKVVWLLMKLLIKLMSGAGQKHAQIQLNQFKKFVESR